MPRPAVSGPGGPGRKRQRSGLTEPGVVCCPGLLGQSLCAPPSLLQRPRDTLTRPRAQVGSSGTSWREGARMPPCSPATPCSPRLVLPGPEVRTVLRRPSLRPPTVVLKDKQQQDGGSVHMLGLPSSRPVRACPQRSLPSWTLLGEEGLGPPSVQSAEARVRTSRPERAAGPRWASMSPSGQLSPSRVSSKSVG